MMYLDPVWLNLDCLWERDFQESKSKFLSIWIFMYISNYLISSEVYFQCTDYNNSTGSIQGGFHFEALTGRKIASSASHFSHFFDSWSVLNLSAKEQHSGAAEELQVTDWTPHSPLQANQVKSPAAVWGNYLCRVQHQIKPIITAFIKTQVWFLPWFLVFSWGVSVMDCLSFQLLTVCCWWIKVHLPQMLWSSVILFPCIVLGSR